MIMITTMMMMMVMLMMMTVTMLMMAMMMSRLGRLIQARTNNVNDCFVFMTVKMVVVKLLFYKGGRNMQL